MNRKLLVFCAVTLPLCLMAVVAQSVVYHDLDRQRDQKLALQDQWLERNKKLLAGVTVLQSPARVDTLAQNSLGLTSLGASNTLKVEFGSSGGRR